MSTVRGPVISPMIVVGDGRAAIEFYEAALGASVRWVLGDGQVACLDVDDPDAVLARATAAGASGSHMESHRRPWGEHRQGGFTDPWGQPWLVGDRGPIEAAPRS